jgi:hypothetical protein
MFSVFRRPFAAPNAVIYSYELSKKIWMKFWRALFISLANKPGYSEELSVLKLLSRVVRCAIRKDLLLFQPRNQVCIDRSWRVSKHMLTVNFFCDLHVVWIEKGGMDKGTLHFHSARQSTTPEGDDTQY